MKFDTANLIMVLSNIREAASSFEQRRVLNSLIKDTKGLWSKKMEPLIIIMDSNSLGVLINCDPHRVDFVNRYYWKKLPIYVDHLAGFRADVIGEPFVPASQEKKYIYESVRKMIRQGVSKEELYDIIDECLLDDLFA